MGLTLGNAAVELRKKSFSSIDEVSSCVASALLRGARGNSGVILSLLFRGISRRLKGLETAGPEEFTAAMNEGVDAAYKAVMKPAEGTILTVSRLASAAAAQASGAGSDLETCLVCALKVGDQALEDTVNQNPVLKKAGVVDAGGMGYLVILRAMLASLRGEAVPDAPSAESAEQKADGRVFTAEKVEIPTVNIFDTVYIVKKKSFDIDLRPLRLYLDSIGDSLVISEDDEIFKVHVHTDIPASALTESLKYGELVVADIENMRMQAEAQQRGEEPMTAQGAEDYEVGKKTPEREEPKEDPDELSFVAPEKDYGVVTVSAGAGMESLFLNDLGCDAVVTGGQTMNPSTDDILRAIARTPASTVFVLPNNKNIIMAAQQAVPLAAEHDRKVIVVPTTTVPQGVSAMLAFNVDSEAGQIAANMTIPRPARRRAAGQLFLSPHAVQGAQLGDQRVLAGVHHRLLRRGRLLRRRGRGGRHDHGLLPRRGGQRGRRRPAGILLHDLGGINREKAKAPCQRGRALQAAGALPAA